MNPFGALMSFLFPRVCHLCGLPLGPGESYVCASCLSRLPRTRYHLRKDNAMEQRFMGLVPFERATGYFFYSRGSDLAKLMADLKYHRYRGLGFRLGSLVGSELLLTGFLSDIDLLVPVPMHFLKKAARGYNQVDELCRGLSHATGIEVCKALTAVRGHRTQTSLTLEQRRRNTAGIFRLAKPGCVHGRHILIVDDVCTTGSTLVSAAGAIADVAPDVKLSLLTVGVTF